MPTADCVTQLRVHIGAHKTATTHLQTVLKSAIHEIQMSGANYLPSESARECFSEDPYSEWEYRIARMFPISRPYLLKSRVLQLISFFNEYVSTKGPLVLSEEDLLGNTQYLMDCQFYPHPTKMHLIHELSRIVPVKIFLSIRSFDEYLPSAYAENLKRRKLSRQSFTRTAEFFMREEYLWLGLFRRIKDIVPNADFEVWIYDDYGSNWGYFCQRLIGTKFDCYPEVSAPIRSRTPSEEAIRAAESLKMQDRKSRSDEVRRIYAEDMQQANRQKFAPFSADDKKIFRSNFANDLRMIKQVFPGVVKRP